jgi:hypothetical protein
MFFQHLPRRPVAAFAGPKLRFGRFRLTQLSYAGFVRSIALPSMAQKNSVLSLRPASGGGISATRPEAVNV